MTKLPKLLCLHGYGQNKSIMIKKSQLIREKLKNQVEFVYISAPNKLPDNHEHVVDFKKYLEGRGLLHKINEFEPLYDWFSRVNNKWQGIDETLVYLNGILKEQGPFTGLMGFSQGGVLGSMLTSLLENQHPLIKPSQHPPLKYNVLMSCFFPYTAETKKYYTVPINTKSIHVWGKLDQLVLPRSSLDHSQKYKDCERIEHDKGHEIPTDPKSIDKIVNFILSNN